MLRGLKTLGIRVERAQQNAMTIAPWLEAHPKVAGVRYIGLRSHPQHELAKRQMSGFGSMISFELKGGFEAGRWLMDYVRVATLAVSLGGVETLIEHPASMTHASMSREARDAAGFTDGLVRYSVGIEDVEDLIDDLDQALAGCGAQAETVQDRPTTPDHRTRLTIARGLCVRGVSGRILHVTGGDLGVVANHAPFDFAYRTSSSRIQIRDLGVITCGCMVSWKSPPS